MKITYLKLVAFKRFPLLDIEVFEHEFKSKLVMITGANGAGKSSLFNELTPLPSDKSNFDKGGYKEIRFHHNNKEYKLISDFREGTKFYFLVDGEEQNLSNNVTTQRELVATHFKITPAIHELLVGGEVFTTMSLLSRKKLFAAITHLNIDKVLDGYNELREELKNNELILKTQTSLLQSEEQKLLDSNRLESLKETQVRTKEFIDFLLELRTELHRYTLKGDPDEVYQHHKSLLDKLKETVGKHYLRLTTYPKGDIERYKLQYSSSLTLVTHQLQDLYTCLENKQDEIKALQLTQQSSLSALQHSHAELTQVIDRLKSSLVFLKDCTLDLDTVRGDIYKLETSLADIVRTIPVNKAVDGKRLYTKERYENLLNTKQTLLTELTEFSSEEIALVKELRDLSSTHDDVSCPNCNHTWSPKDTPALIVKAKQKLTTVLENKRARQDALAVNNKELEEIVEYFTLYKQYATLRQATKQTLPLLWEHIDQNEYIFNDPPAVLVAVQNCNMEAISLETVGERVKQLHRVDKDIQTLASVKDLSLSAVESQNEDLILAIDDAQQYKAHLISQLAEINKAATVHMYIDKLQNALKASVSDLFSTNLSTSLLDILNVIESDLSKHKVTLIETENELHRYNSIQYTIEKYRATIEDTKTNIKVLGIVLDELSPKNGLIAKSISSFLNVIISNINKTIAGLWEYKMVLTPISVENEALNYKFKVEVEDKLTISDIAIASKGMQEAINLSFKLILYKLLGLEGTPLFLDELGSNLDAAHSNNLLNLINGLSVSDKFSQIFLITHKENYGFLKDIEQISLS